jgi:hypothetical protein
MRYELTDEELLAIQQDHLDHANREVVRMEAEVDAAVEGETEHIRNHREAVEARLKVARAHKAASVKKADAVIARLKRAGKRVPDDPSTGV